MCERERQRERGRKRERGEREVCVRIELRRQANERSEILVPCVRGQVIFSGRHCAVIQLR